MGLLLFLAWKALGENRLSLLLLLLAVAIGVGFQIPNRANLAGFRDEIMRQEVSSGLGHVRVRPRQGERFEDVTAMMASIARLPSVKAVEPILVLPGVVKKGGHVVVLGVTGVNASAREHPYERTVGADLAPGDDHGALLGERLAKKLGTKGETRLVSKYYSPRVHAWFSTTEAWATTRSPCVASSDSPPSIRSLSIGASWHRKPETTEGPRRSLSGPEATT